MNDDIKTSDDGRKLIEEFEGCILQAYDDASDHIVKAGQYVHGTLTIGYGHTDAAGPPKVYIGQVITKEQADQFLSVDLQSVELEVKHLVKVALNQNQFDALVSFQFNTGWLGHPNCSLLKALNSGNYQLADEDFMLYDRAQGKVLAGLSRRRQAEKDLFHKAVTT
jgi:lysozyme